MDRFISKNEQGHVFYYAEYNREGNYVYSNWRGFIDVEQVKSGCNLGIEAIRAYSCPYLLNDNSHLYGPFQDANDWIIEDWAPRAVDAGLKFFAHIISPNLFVEASARDLESKFKTASIKMKVFENKAAAIDWLQDKMKRAK